MQSRGSISAVQRGNVTASLEIYALEDKTMDDSGMNMYSDGKTLSLSFEEELDNTLLRCSVRPTEDGQVYACYLYLHKNGTKKTIYKDSAYSPETSRQFDLSALLPEDELPALVSVKLFVRDRNNTVKRSVQGKLFYYPPMTGPKLSVIMPVRGMEVQLEETLRSLTAQKYHNVEYIILAMGTGDTCEDSLRAFTATVPCARVYRKKSMPAWEAFNFGAEIAEGDYLLFLDAGDRIDPALFSDAMREAESCQADIVSFPAKRPGCATGERVCASGGDDGSEITGEEFILWNKIFRRSFLAANRLRFPACFGSDAVFAFTTYALAERTVALDDAYILRGVYNEEPVPALQSEDPISVITLLLEMKKSLTDKEVYRKTEARFLRFALSYVVSGLELMRDFERFQTAYRAVKRLAIPELGLLQKPAGYYLKENEPLYREAAACMQLSALEFVETYGMSALLSHRRILSTAPVSAEKKDPRVSVVVPVYNTEQYLRECLDSILESTMRNFEVLCVNDGSADGSRSILEEYQKKDSRIVVLDSRKNRGLAASRNAAFDIARGEYICCVDSDDWIEPDHLEKSFEYAKRYDLDMLFFDAAAHYESPELKERFEKSSRQYTSVADLSIPRSGKQMLFDMIDTRTYRSNMCLQMLRKGHLDRNRIRLYPGILYEDVLFTFESLLKSELCARISHPYYHRRYREGSIIMQQKGFPHIRSYVIVIMEMMSELRKADLGREGEARAFSRVHSVANAMNAAYEALTEKEKTTFLERYLTPVEASWFQMIRQNRI